jgi:hypothetical protein
VTVQDEVVIQPTALVACKIVLHTGRDLHELTPEDLLGYRAWNMVSDRPTSASVQLVWAGLDGIADLRGIKSFAAAIRSTDTTS